MNIFSRGFTLIEMMIVVALIGIIVAFAFPSYQSQIQRSSRSDAMVMLTSASNFQERNFSKNGEYTENELQLNPHGTESENGFYDFTVLTNATDTSTFVPPTATGVSTPAGGTTDVTINMACTGSRCFMMVATAKGRQLQDSDCAAFSIDNLGRKLSYDSTGSTNPPGTCWR